MSNTEKIQAISRSVSEGMVGVQRAIDKKWSSLMIFCGGSMIFSTGIFSAKMGMTEVSGFGGVGLFIGAVGVYLASKSVKLESSRVEEVVQDLLLLYKSEEDENVALSVIRESREDAKKRVSRIFLKKVRKGKD